MSKTLLLAEWIAPMDGPVLRGGAVVFDRARILAVGDARSMRAAHPDAAVVDAGSAVVLPGLINAHTHLELSDQCRPEGPAGTFVDWIKRVRVRSPSDDQVRAAARAGIEESLRFGVTAVGDVGQKNALTRPVIASSGVGGVSFGEVIALGQLRHQAQAMIEAATSTTASPGGLEIGLTPHAPYTVEESVYRRCLEIAQALRLPVATHLAETPDEALFLSDHAGPFRALWDSIGLWSDPPTRFEGGPVRYAKHLGLLDYARTVLAHVNYADDAELDVLSRGVASVVYCPRTHAYFGHPAHRWRDMLARGVNVCVGTDSRASSPDLDLVEELRVLHRLAPDGAAGTLWEMVTTGAASALGMREKAGALAAGKAASLVVFPVTGPAPLTEILEKDLMPGQVWLNGVCVITSSSR